MSVSERSEHMSQLGKKGAQSRRIAAVERRIRELVDAAPPLTDGQRSRLAALLQPQGAA